MDSTLSDEARSREASFVGFTDDALPLASAAVVPEIRMKAELAFRGSDERLLFVVGWQSKTSVGDKSGGTVYGGLSFGF